MTTTTEIVSQIAAAMSADQYKAKAVVDAWLEREGVQLDKREYRRFCERVYVSNGASYPWRRLLNESAQTRMGHYLEWAQSRRRWSQN